jgi:hypothetical protein
MTASIQHITSYLNKQVSIKPLVILRIIFGVMMAFSTIRFVALGWVKEHYISPVFHFKYYGFEWISMASPNILYAIHYAMILASIFVAFGFLYRISTTIVFLSFTYTELLDLTYYLNHYYFVSIVCFFMIIVPAHKKASLDVYFGWVKEQDFIYQWYLLLFKAQLSIVYFYAGLAKINTDWLFNALPLKIWLPANDKMPIIGSVFTWKLTPYLFSWFGMLYDCTIPAFLQIRKTRIFAYITVVVFHTMTGLLFQIGVFPLVMILATLIFFSEEWHSRLFDAIFGKKQSLAHGYSSEIKNKILIYFFTLYFVFQVVFPWRYLLYDGNLFWTEEGYRFSWRVMLMEKAGTATFFVKDSKTGKEGAVNNSEFLNLHQEKQMAMQPDMILQFAHFLADYYEKQGVTSPEVRAEVYVTLNGQPSQLFINPHLNLAKVQDTWQQKDWILPHQTQ